MATYVPHNLLTIYGDRVVAGQPTDTWSVGFRMGGSVPNQKATESHNEALADLVELSFWKASPIGLANFNCSATRLVGFKWNPIKADGHYLDRSLANTWEFPVPIPGIGGETPDKVPQTAIVATLDTGRKGARYRGRVYLPTDKITIGSDWALPVGAGQPTNSVANIVVGFIRALNGWSSGLGANMVGLVCVASGYGHNTQVTSVRVGNRLDTQRRRREQFEETYVAEQV